MTMSERPLRVLFVTSEIAPFSKTGGLADVSAALPGALSQLNCEVRVVSPRYGFIDRERHGIRLNESPSGLQADFRGRSLKYGFSHADRTNGYDVYFVECDSLYDRPGVYVDPFTNRDYVDNDYRFILLSRSALTLCHKTGWTPDIVHCNDWQTSLIPFYVNRQRAQGGLRQTRTLLTIHNIAYHGLFGKDALDRIGEGAAGFYSPGGAMEYYSHVNFLKAGLEFADMLNTVSPTYAREIQSSYEFGYGLETVLRARGSSVAGILNGIDTMIWNPASDHWIPERYGPDTLDKKAANKKTLCERLGFPFNPAVPLIGSVSRIVGQKGFEIVAPILSEILNLPAQAVILGSGDPHLEHVFHEFARVFPDRFTVRIGYDEELSHLIEAGADMFLMPSKYEPCGLNQMMSMRYGTLPIVRATGGLADTVTDANADQTNATGFSFTDFSPEALLRAVQRAAQAFSNRNLWMALQHNAMHQDFSWRKSAQRYRDLYEQCLSHPARELP
jgi:starch synthase